MISETRAASIVGKMSFAELSLCLAIISKEMKRRYSNLEFERDMAHYHSQCRKDTLLGYGICDPFSPQTFGESARAN